MSKKKNKRREKEILRELKEVQSLDPNSLKKIDNDPFGRDLYCSRDQHYDCKQFDIAEFIKDTPPDYKDFGFMPQIISNEIDSINQVLLHDCDLEIDTSIDSINEPLISGSFYELGGDLFVYSNPYFIPIMLEDIDGLYQVKNIVFRVFNENAWNDIKTCIFEGSPKILPEEIINWLNLFGTFVKINAIDSSTSYEIEFELQGYELPFVYKVIKQDINKPNDLVRNFLDLIYIVKMEE